MKTNRISEKMLKKKSEKNEKKNLKKNKKMKLKLKKIWKIKQFFKKKWKKSISKVNLVRNCNEGIRVETLHKTYVGCGGLSTTMSGLPAGVHGGLWLTVQRLPRAISVVQLRMGQARMIGIPVVGLHVHRHVGLRQQVTFIQRTGLREILLVQFVALIQLAMLRQSQAGDFLIRRLTGTIPCGKTKSKLEI